MKLFSQILKGSPVGAPRPDLKKFGDEDSYDIPQKDKVNRTQPTNTPTPPTANLLKAAQRPAKKSEVRLVFNSDDWLFTQATALCSLPVEEDGYTIPPEAAHLVNGNGNAWSNEILLKYFRTFVGAHNYIDHDQDPSRSHGVIVDVVLRKIPVEGLEGGFCYYADILIATNRHKDPVWANMVESGEVRYLSMGCISSSVTCSKCGFEAVLDEDSCYHQDFELGMSYIDASGNKNIVADLVTDAPDENGDRYVKFIEESYLSVDPAFTGAVQGHVLSLDSNTDVELIIPREAASREAFQVHRQYIGGLE